MRCYNIGDKITGRCVTNGTQHTGRVVQVIEPMPYSGDSSPRYKIHAGTSTKIIFA